MMHRRDQTMELDRETMESTDRILQAAEIAETEINVKVGSNCIEPFAMKGDLLVMRKAKLSELSQNDVVFCRQMNSQKFYFAYVGVVSVTNSWVCLANVNPDDFITLWHYEIGEIYLAILRNGIALKK